MRGAFLLLVMLAGCEAKEYAPYSDDYVRKYFMREIELSDGTRCVLYNDNAIACDWGHSTE